MNAGRFVLPAAILASLLVHLAVALSSPRAKPPASAPLERGIASALRPRVEAAAVRRDRARLVERGRRKLSQRKLELGEFLIAAAAIDAREQGSPLDQSLGLELYRERVRRLARRLDAGVSLVDAVPALFGDLHYDLTEGRVLGALLGGGGNCEAISQLVAAAVHDAGRPGLVELWYWGGTSAGRPAHLAPVVGDHDLVTGKARERGGRSFAATELVERYAALHVLGRASARPSAEGRAFAKYPENSDTFPGATPLYADRALSAPAASTVSTRPVSVLDAAFGGGRCWASLHDLAAPEVDVWLGHEVLTLSLYRTGTSHDLSELGAELGSFEQALARTTDPDDRLLSFACLAIAYERAAVRFAAHSKTALANALMARRRRALAEADRLSAKLVLPKPTPALMRIDEGAEGWMLVVVPALENQLFEHALVTLKGRPTTLLVALLAYPRTSARALTAIDRLAKTTQLVLAMALFFPTYTGFRESLLGTRRDSELARLSNAIADLYALSPRTMDQGMSQAIRDARVDPSWLAAWDELRAMSPSKWRDPPP